MKVAIASDHAGFAYKQLLLKTFSGSSFEFVDLGTDSTDPVDYPDKAAEVAEYILSGSAERGILICGSGVGVSVVANKFKGIRAGVCHDHYSAHQCVEHDNVNVLCLGQEIVGEEVVLDIVHTYLKAQFSEAPRHVRRLQKLDLIENKNLKEKQS